MTGQGPRDSAAISPAMAEGLLADLAGAAAVVLAVSGGPDSLALMHLAAQWRRDGLARGALRPALHVAVVDHQLRAESAAEAQMVCARARERDLPCTVLVWQGEKPERGVAAAAREARYQLLFAHAHALGASHVVTAHHADDLAETILMRLSAGSGLAGLAGMQPFSQRAGLTLARPMLPVAKDRLVATCVAAGLSWDEDPGNRDPDKVRGRLRLLEQQLRQLGLSRARLLRLGARAARADAALEQATLKALDAAQVEAGPRVLRFNAGALSAQPEEIFIRALERLLAQAGAGALRLERLEQAAAALGLAAGEGRALRRSLGGRVLSLGRDGQCTVTPEPPRRRGRARLQLPAPSPAMPDNDGAVAAPVTAG